MHFKEFELKSLYNNLNKHLGDRYRMRTHSFEYDLVLIIFIKIRKTHYSLLYCIMGFLYSFLMLACWNVLLRGKNANLQDLQRFLEKKSGKKLTSKKPLKIVLLIPLSKKRKYTIDGTQIELQC